MESAKSPPPPSLPLPQPLVKPALPSYLGEGAPAAVHSGQQQSHSTQVQESNLWHQTLVANLPCVIYRCVSNELWIAEFVSEGCEQITGYPAAAFINNQKRSLATLVAPQDWERVRQQLQQAFVQRQPYALDYRILHADGSERWVAERGYVVTIENNGGRRREGLLFNITEQKQNEAILAKINQELQESARLTGEFLANVSHEIRTPLSVILTIAESLQEGIYGAPTVRQVEALARLRRSGRHLLGLINDILDMAKMEVGKLTLYQARVAVETVCNHSLQMVQELAQSKQISLRYEKQSNAQWLWADEQRLRQILVNLLANGIKFTPEGGTVGLTVTTDPVDEVIHLSVWDTGIGIATAETGKIFQPFVQLDTKLSRHYEGTGLGLTLVYHLTRLHGGGITLESTEGKGSRFTISLPWREEGSSTAPPRMTVAAVQQQKPRLLVLTTEENETQKFIVALKAYEIEVTATDNLQHAITAACQQRPDLILIEAPLPDYSIAETVHQLRTLGAAFHTPIVALTTVQVASHQTLWQQTGIVTCLPSPINFRRLAALVYSYSSKAAGQ